MDIEQRIKDCEFNLKQINYFNPDPYFVSHFFENYIKHVKNFYLGIIEEASIDYGLVSSSKTTITEFAEKAYEKNDEYSLKFLSWYNENFKNEHKTPYPNFIKKAIFMNATEYHCSKFSIKLISNQRYQDDPFLEIKFARKDNKPIYTDMLNIEMNRQIPIFLDIINKKRKNNNEPKVLESQVIPSAFLKKNGVEGIEILKACEVYLFVLNRILKESRKKIKELTKASYS